MLIQPDIIMTVSTRSRPKAAGCTTTNPQIPSIRFNTQPPEGGWEIHAVRPTFHRLVSTRSRPKAAG